MQFYSLLQQQASKESVKQSRAKFCDKFRKVSSSEVNSSEMKSYLKRAEKSNL